MMNAVRSSLVTLSSPTLPAQTESDTAAQKSGRLSSPPVSAGYVLVKLEAQKRAADLIRAGDKALASRHSAALMDQIVAGHATSDGWSKVNIDIPPVSTFGRAWAQLTHAINSEPFASYARAHKIDTSTLELNSESGWELECVADGKPQSFSKYDLGYREATAAVTKAAQALTPTLRQISYTNADSAPCEVVSDFYAARTDGTDNGRLKLIALQQQHQSFEALREPGSKAAQPNLPAYSRIREKQQEAIDDLSAEISTNPELTPIAQHTPKLSVETADREMARKSASALLSLRPEMSGYGTGRHSNFAASEIPEYSTLGQTLRALIKSTSSDAFTRFTTLRHIEPETAKINTLTGDLLCSVRGSDGQVVEKTFKMANDSEWAAIAPSMLPHAKSLASGANVNVWLNQEALINLATVNVFYGEPKKADTLEGVLEQASRLTRTGFRALNNDNPPTDPAALRIQEKQRAAIQKLQPAPPPSPPVINPLASIARRQFAGEPNVQSVAARLLSDALKKATPALDFDINQLAIATPDPDKPGEFGRAQLTTLALDFLLDDGAPALASNTQAFDTRPDRLTHTGIPASVPLAIDVPALNVALRALRDQLNEAYASDSREYWNRPAFGAAPRSSSVFPGSHRELVSHILRSNLQQALLKQPGLDDEQRQTLDMVTRHHEGATRPLPLVYSSPANVYTIGSTTDLLIQRFIGQTKREILLVVESSGKITPFKSWDDLPKGAKEQVDGNTFDLLADKVIEHHRLNLPPTMDTAHSTRETTQLPDWMSQASEAERFVLHELNLRLASFMQLNKGRTYNSDVPDIRTFAQRQFDLLPEARKLTSHAAKDLEVVFNEPYGGSVGAPNGFVSGGITRKTMSLTDMLLNNLSGLPKGRIEVFRKTGTKENGVDVKVRVPELEKELELRKIVSDLDIGATYPALLKEKLLDDPDTMAQRRELFVQQVPLELQYKALELSIRGKSGFNATGFRYVQEIFKPGPSQKMVDGKAIAIRPLAFDDKPNGKVDVVEGAYLIESEDQTGPVILLRPLSGDAPIQQFASRQALLEAIQNPGKLQNDTLAWMADDNIRLQYKGDGFKHPNVVLLGINFGSGGLNKVNPLAGDNRLEQKLLDGKLLEYLYEANVKSLTTLAGQKSTSSAQSRWASLKEGGFLLLNAVLQVVEGPGAILAKVLQAEGILRDVEILSGDNARAKEAALADMFVNLASSLIHFKARSLDEQPNKVSIKPPPGANLLIDEAAPIGAPKNAIVLGGPADIKPLSGDIQVFVDSYKGKPRLNIMGHGETPVGEEGNHIVGEDGKRYTAEDIDLELKARGMDIQDYPQVRLLTCYSAKGGNQSLAAQLHERTGVPVKGFEQEIITDYNGVGGEDPFMIYNDASARYRKKYAGLSDDDIHALAEKELNRKLAGRDIQFNLRKDTGTDVDINIGSDEKPVIYRTKVDYQPRTFGTSRAKPTVSKPVEVDMGYSHTVEDAHSTLKTRSLTDCSALAVLTDLKDGVYQKRTLMHLTGSNLEFGLFDKDTYKVLEDLDKSLADGGKVVFVGGIDSQSPVGMGVVLGQEHKGKKPLLDMLRKRPGVETVVASSLGIAVNPDGSFKLIEGTGKGVFTQSMINAAFDFAD